MQNAFEMASLPTATGKGAAIPWDDLRTIVGAEQVRSAGPGDRVAGVQPEAVFEPGNEKELAAALHCADAAGLQRCAARRGHENQLGQSANAR